MSESKYSKYSEQLYISMKRARKDEDTIINITTSEPLKERLKIK